MVVAEALRGGETEGMESGSWDTDVIGEIGTPSSFESFEPCSPEDNACAPLVPPLLDEVTVGTRTAVGRAEKEGRLNSGKAGGDSAETFGRLEEPLKVGEGSEPRLELDLGMNDMLVIVLLEARSPRCSSIS